MKQETSAVAAPSPLEQFLSELEKLANLEEKLTACIEFMQRSLSQEKTPDFRGFWEIRKLCFSFFKEQVTPQLRVEMWSRYVDLTREGRRLKNLLDEESSFAAGQIDLAIAALEEEVKSPKEVPFVFEKLAKALEGRYDFYEKMQKELSFLNLFSSRINALRKELIKTDMRIRHKNKFFQRLSLLGDAVFPRRKEMIKELSEAFTSDVAAFHKDHFSEENFSEEKARRFVFFYREEIKSLQALAKQLTINTQAFTSTRQLLSDCWDMLRGVEKELKKEQGHVKQKSQENRQEAEARIQKIAERFASQEISYNEGYLELKEVLQWMKQIELTKVDVTFLKDLIAKTKAPMTAVEEGEIAAKKEREQEIENQRKEKVENFKGQLQLLRERCGGESSVEELFSAFEGLKEGLSGLPISKAERLTLERQLKELRDKIAEREQASLLLLPEDAKEQLDLLQKMLEERVQRRKEIKGQLEEYRKIMGGSNLDFEKAMKYNELMASDKKNLEKCDASIVEIENKIKDIKNQN